MNAHHILFPRASYESHFATRDLRRNPTLIVPLDDEIHGLLHHNIPVVPLLDHFTAMTVRREFYPNPHHHPLRTMDNLMQTIDHAIQGEKVKPIQRQLGELAIHAIDLQRFFVSIGSER